MDGALETPAQDAGAIAGSAPPFRKLRPHPNGPSREQVAADQRARLRGAVVEAVARHGCAKLSGDELCKLAGVSKHTLYEHYGDGVTGCLVDACEQLARRAVG